MSHDEDLPLVERARRHAAKLVRDAWPEGDTVAAATLIRELRAAIESVTSLAYLHGYAAGVDEAGRPLRRKK